MGNIAGLPCECTSQALTFQHCHYHHHQHCHYHHHSHPPKPPPLPPPTPPPSPPPCTPVKPCNRHKHPHRRLFAALLILIILVLLTILITWAAINPKKPTFVLQDATVFCLNPTAPNLLTTNLQVTITSRNPNSRIGIYYDRLRVYATYRSQQISYYTALPPNYEGHAEINTWSPFVYGTAIPVAPYNGAAISSDLACGSVLLMIKIEGLVRFKIGAFISRRYRLHVKCPATTTFGDRSSGVVVGGAIKYQIVQRCSVSLWPG